MREGKWEGGVMKEMSGKRGGEFYRSLFMGKSSFSIFNVCAT